MKDDKYLRDEIDDSNLRQCKFCNYIINEDDIPTGNDPFSGESGLAYCPQCNEGEPFTIYRPKK